MPAGTELLLLLVVAVLGFVLLEAAIRNTFVGTLVVLIGTALHTTFDYLPDLWFGSARVGLWDVLGLLFLGAALARLLRSPGVSGLQWLLIVFGLVAFVSLGLGIVEFGANTAFNEFRRYFAYLSVALYFSTVVPEHTLLDRIGRAWMFLAGFLVLLALLRWAVLPLGLTGGAFGTGQFRVLPSSTTLILLQAFVIGVVAWSGDEAPRWMRRVTPLLLAAVVLMQHRTVWAALVVVMAVMIVRHAEVRRRLVPMVALSLFAIAVLNFTVLARDSDDLTTQLAEAAAFRATWEWRVEGWRALLDDAGPRNAVEQLLGKPFGGGWERMVHGRVATVSPHNFYVHTYLRIGLLGLGFLVLLYAALLRRLRSKDHASGILNGPVIFLLLVTQVVFYIPYASHPDHGLIFGLAIAVASLSPSIRGTAGKTVEARA